MPSDRRGRHYDDGYESYSDDDYQQERRPRPRRKSTTRDIIDRVSRSIGRLGINRSPSRTRTSRPPRYSPSPSPSPSPPPAYRSHRPGYSRRRSSSYYPPSSSRSRPLPTRRSSSYSPSSRKRGGQDLDKSRWQHAAKSAFDAALVEVARVRKEPGSWTGGKGARVATAALGAAAVDALVVGGKDPEKHGKRKSMEAALGGLVLNRLVNGGRKELRRRDSHR